jgi:O-antigen ligase
VASLLLTLFAAILLGDGGKNLFVWAVGSGVLLVAWAILLWRGQVSEMTGHPVFPALVCFGFLFSLRCLVFSDGPASLAALGRFWPAVAFSCLALSVWTDRHRWAFVVLLLFGAFLQGVFLFGSFGIERSLGAEWPPLLISNNPQYGGFWLSVGALLCLDKTVQGKGPWKFLWGSLSLFLVGALFFYPSRAGLVAFGVGSGVLIFRHFRGKGFLFYGLLLVLFLGVLTRETGSRLIKAQDPLSWKRADIWRTAIRGFCEKPFWGWGPGGFENVYRRHGRPQEDQPRRFGLSTAFAHNEYLQIGCEYGLPAFLFLIWGVFLALWTGPPGVQAALCAISIFCFFNFPLVAPVNGLLVAGLLALSGPFHKTVSFPAYGRRVLAVGAGLLGCVALTAAAATLTEKVPNPWDNFFLLSRADQLIHSPSSSPQNIKEAEILVGRFLRRSPENGDGWHLLSHIQWDHFSPPRGEEALRSLEKALVLHPHQALWWLELSQRLEVLGQNEGARRGSRRAARRALELEPRDESAREQVHRLSPK